MLVRSVACWMVTVGLCLAAWVPAAAQTRSETHEKYASALWKSLYPASGPRYVRWTVAPDALDLPAGPPSGSGAKTYLNAAAAANAGKLPYGSIVVTEHPGAADGGPAAVTICYRFQPGYHPASDDWYWATYLPDGQVVRTVADKAPYDKPGFVTRVTDGRLWVFRPGSAELAEFEKSGDLAKHVTRPGAGPQGMTVKAADGETLDAYLRVALGGQPADG